MPTLIEVLIVLLLAASAGTNSKPSTNPANPGHPTNTADDCCSDPPPPECPPACH